MSLLSRLLNALRPNRLNRDIDEELQSHLDEAIHQGRHPAEARRALGSPLQHREASRDIRLLPWLDSLRADATLACRHILKRKVTSASAILSLALAIGACTTAFQLIDALLLRPLPVTHPDQLYNAARQGLDSEGKLRSIDHWAYPAFALMRDAVHGRAELLAVSLADRVDLTYASDQEMEKAYLQYVSGALFGSFGLSPALGRLLSPADDQQPGAHPLAVLSHDYWTRRFAADPSVLGRKVRIGETFYQIIGVVQAPFTGTEPGTMTDIFVPTMMHPYAVKDDATWHRILARVQPGVPIEPLRAKLDAVFRAFEENRARGFSGMSKADLARFLSPKFVLEHAPSGASRMQSEFRPALIALAILVSLVLLIACANIANLMAAQSAARSREMALRVSIGAGRARLVQLVLVESAVLASLAAAVGLAFAAWAAPFVVSLINPPDNPARLLVALDWRVFAFTLALTLLVTCLFGLAPALRAAAVQPAGALKGGVDPHSKRRLMHSLIAVQTAFCFLVIFLAGLFVATFQHLSQRPTGFQAEGLLVLETVAQRPQPTVYWDQVAAQLRTLPGVRSVAQSGWPLLGGKAWNGFISVNAAPPGPVLAYFLDVSPGWLETMRIRFLEGADFRPGDTTPGPAIVNQAFLRQFLPNQRPIGTLFAKGDLHFRIIGVVQDAPYRDIHEATPPVVYVPHLQLDSKGAERPIGRASYLVRAATDDPLSIAASVRAEITRLRPDFRVSNLRTQSDLVRAQTIRERLLAMLALFFAVVALLLAGVGLYGVLDYSVLQRRREIGIRIAIGARSGHIAWRVTADSLTMVIIGAISGLALGLASARALNSLLYGVHPTDFALLAAPAVAVLTAAALAAAPAMVRAVRIDPATMLRTD